ncbi:MAG: right-handed parallel beta-helix repeat-containing protein [Phycisphaerales bacterium]
MKLHPLTVPAGVVSFGLLAAAGLMSLRVTAGPLEPPLGPVSPTYKTLSEIEPRVAISKTNTPGDADSVFRITQPGSYYLTTDVGGEATKKGIEILIGGGQQVTIDLNGFSMNGTGATSTQAAIYIDGVDAKVVVRNGAIRNWKNAIQHFLGGSITVQDVHAYGSSAIQFDLRNATVERCFAHNGSSHGFFVDGGVLVDCTSKSNSGSGFTINSSSIMVRGCSAIGNGNGGFNLGGGIAENCRAESNTGHGFTSPGAMVNCASLLNTGDGVSASFASVIRGCDIGSNGSDGIAVASNSRIESNSIFGNTAHGVNCTGSRTTIVNNSISTNGRGTGIFAGVFVGGSDNCVDGNHITNMTLAGDDFGIQVTGTSNLIVRNQLSALSTYFSVGAGNTSGGSSTTPSTAGAWVNITY